MRFDYEPGEVVEVEHRLPGKHMIVRCGVVLDNLTGKKQSRHYLVLIGLEKWECVIAGGIFIPCKRRN